MNEVIGFLLIGIAITFFVTFAMGDSLNTKEKLKLAFGIIAFLATLIFGAYFLTQSGIFD